MAEYMFDILRPVNSERTEEGFLHKKCGEMVMTATVTLSNRSSLLPMAGDGSVERWPVPYCPNCEDEPHPHGTLNDAGEISHPSFIKVV
ncbi:MAG TPA: hypothetical protein VF996_02715 [Candidatus Saccharimonadales bacterium]|jgi:hypothetical protein